MKNKTATVSPPAALSKGLRLYLYITAAVTGAAVMVVEILGAKMLSPYVGLSHFVWTAQIAVTLVALACGYYVGGRLADRAPNLSWLYWSILAAAAYLTLTVMLCEPVAYWCLDFKLAIGSLLASTILFFVPLALMAMTAPFLVRVITSSVAGVGGNVGRLTSISTLGSFAGTMLIGYVMIPFLPNSVTMYVMAGLLTLVCLIYFAVFRGRMAGAVIFALTFLTIGGLKMYEGLKPHYREWIQRFRGNSHFGQLQVMDRPVGTGRYYLNDYLIQNTYDTERKQSMSQFTYMLAGLARVYTTNINDVLCIGLGVGIVPMDFARQGARVDVVEINPAVVPVAQRFFGLEPDKLNITIDDGRHYLNRCKKKYDAVVLDAFLGDSSPSHLLTRQAFASIQRVLRPGGVLSINVFGQLEEGRDWFSASLEKTLKSVFAEVRIHSSGDGALFVAASDRSPFEFLHAPQVQGIHPRADEETRLSYSNIVHTVSEHGIVLTDDYNPTDFFDAHNREQVRRSLASWAKEM